MRLKNIRLAGFKSFVDPTNIPFPSDMTAVVGPNGCGKSNVIDAVRWVLGESSAKNLRGDAMTDVIFNGSSARKPVSQSSVELVFDNTSGRIQGEYAGYIELSIKRVVTREAISSYYLNGTKCRRRDVTDLFLGTGLGPRSYAIIEQGMISRLIESKPQELRVFIEEAAGISRYKERRKETENRMRHTRENLERLEDVRLELGQQLDKLQRQATAARRYKELKANERKLKGELVAIRWLKHSTVITDLEKQIVQQEVDIQRLVAQQRGEESNMTVFREQQADLKQQLDDIQQHNFNLATDITRIEQNQIHAKQRAQHILTEKTDLTQQRDTANRDIANAQEQLAQLDIELEISLPKQEAMAEQLQNNQTRLHDKEQQLQQKQQYWRELEQQSNRLKQQIQNVHSQIQSGLTMQLRTEQRIQELQEEITRLSDNELQEEWQLTQEEWQTSQLEEQAADEDLQAAKRIFEQSKTLLNEAKEARQTQQAQWQKATVTLNSLQDLQKKSSRQGKSVQQWIQQEGLSAVSVWDDLQVHKGWEKALETALQQWQNGLLIPQSPQQLAIEGLQVFFSDKLTAAKPAGTLAEYCAAARVPMWLTQIKAMPNEPAAREAQAMLLPHESCMTPNGLWLGKDWAIFGTPNNQSSTLERLAQIQQLQGEVDDLQATATLLAEREAQCDSEYQAADNRLQTAQQQHQGHQASSQQLGKQVAFLQQQLGRQASQLVRLEDDLAQKQQQKQEEQVQLEDLTIVIAELEEQGEESDELAEIDEQRRQWQEQIEQLRNDIQLLQQRAHRVELETQAQLNQQQTLQTEQMRIEKQQLQWQQKLTLLTAEQEELTMPMKDQAQRLAELLQSRTEALSTQQHIADQLAEVDSALLDFEKGRDGVINRVEKAKEAQQATKVDCEGYRARANAVLEQLQEWQQPLKPLLQALPDEADEQVWQAQLNKTTASLSRLGAVNLAAVEEYQIQAERKQHLDTQNNDLVAALDTLEQAIKKIDRETRARFKATYDRVNQDLKQLFPKVFGGGAAYLELTDDDLLETGVTIMARPPGKKNSTIHLLSGGEKALTALSLVFAIFRLNPAPFCLLDEVDAPLDDANVGRFCKLVSEMSKTVQFIYITHNKIAMEMALHLTGVTMAEPGVSRIVAVDVDEAMAIANA